MFRSLVLAGNAGVCATVCVRACAGRSGAARPIRPAERSITAQRCAIWKQRCSLQFGSAGEAFSEEDRSHHQAVQARRGEGGASGSRTAGHHRHRSQGLRPAEGPRRTLSRRRIHRRLPAQGENRDRDRATTWSRRRSTRSGAPPRPAASATARSSSPTSKKPSASEPANPGWTPSEPPPIDHSECIERHRLAGCRRAAAIHDDL